MFRLKASHLQTYTTGMLPDALPNLGSHSVYNCRIHLIKVNYMYSTIVKTIGSQSGQRIW